MTSNVIDFPNSPAEPEKPPASDDQAAEVVKPEKVKGSATEGERRPIVPAPLQKANLKATAKHHGGLTWHRARYHGFRTPRYVPLAAGYAVVGVLRIVAAQLGWAMDASTEYLAREAVGKSDAREYLSLSKHAMNRRRIRLGVLGAEAVCLIVACTYLAFLPWFIGVSVLVCVLPVLAHVGRPEDKPIVKSAVVPPVYEAPTPVIIERALGSLSIAAINAHLKEENSHIAWVTDVHRDGAGWGVQFDLPHGVTAGDVLAKRDALASGLRRPLSAVWPAGVPSEHPGRVDLWIGFQDQAKMAPPVFPAVKSGVTDVFGPVPFGVDPRSRPVTAGLFELNWLIGAAPGQGKTATVRCLAASAVLDTVCDIWTHEFSGKGDLEALAKVSHRYVGGLDDESIEYGAASLAMLRRELERRSAVFKKIPRDQRSHGKITRELAAKKANNLRPIVAIFDECQNLFMDAKHGKQAKEDAAYVIRLGRAYGLIVILSTQRPDKSSLPTEISGIVTARFCLHVPDQVSNDMILGTSQYAAGYRATLFRAKTDAGSGWLRAEDQPQTVRTYYLDLNAFEKVCQRGRTLRDQAGVLSGYALGEADELADRDALADVLAVIPATESGIHWPTLAERLAERFPDRWAGTTADAVSAQVRDLGVTTGQVKVGGLNKQGVKRRDLERVSGS